MSTLIYSMTVSLDGFVEAPGGKIDWTAPSDELHRLHNERTSRLDAHLLGRGLYETMTYWDTALEDPTLGEPEREFAPIWQELPKVVFSSTLAEVGGNARLVRENALEEVAQIRDQPGGAIGVGGPRFAHALIEHDLIDEFQRFVAPIVLGAGTPFFPPLARRLELELVETRTFANGTVLLHHRRVRD